jgi:hypothetical protein
MNKMRLSLAAVLLASAVGYGAIVNQIGSYNGWDALSWNVISNLNDPDDGTNEQEDFVGDSSNPGAYWADNGTYVFFRFRLDIGTITANTFRDAHFILIDVNDYLYGTGFGSDNVGMPDYGFAWDSKSNDPLKHGLEMLHINRTANVWNGINMDDLDGSGGLKLDNDINGAGRTTDGYVRTIDGIETVNFGTTTFMDFAVSWSYLETYTDLARGQNWRIALASVSAATDHNNLNSDIGGRANPSDSNTLGWTTLGAIPEPATALLE